MYKTRQERPYRPPLPGSDSRRGSMVPAFARKNCRVRHPALFRGNWCGLRESPRRRNDSAIPLSRAKQLRGSGYRTGHPGGTQLPAQCRFRRCTPRGPRGTGGRSPRRVLGTPHRAEKSPAGGSTSRRSHRSCHQRPLRGPDARCALSTESVRYCGRRGIAGQRAAASRPYGEDGARRKAQVGGPM